MWSNRAFLRFWTAGSVSYGGTLVTTVVLPILVYQRTGSAFETSLLAGIETIPYLAFGLVAGAISDHANRRRMMYTCESISAVLVGSVPVANALGVLTIAQIYVVAAGTATTFVWRDAANFGAIPSLVGRDMLASAYAWMSSTSAVLQIAGPAVGGILAATIGPAPAMSIDSASYIFSAIALATIRKPFSTTARNLGATLRQRVAEGLRFLWRQPMVRAMTLLGFGNSVTLGIVEGLLVVDANRQLGLSRTSALIGFLFAAGAAGALLAAVVLPYFRRRFDVVTNWRAGRNIEIVLVLAFAFTTNVVLAMAVYLLFNAGSQFCILVGITYRQEVTPDHLQGRVNVVARMIAWGGTPFGAVIGGVAATIWSVRVALVLAGLGVGSAFVLSLVGPLSLAAARRGISAGDPSGGND